MALKKTLFQGKISKMERGVAQLVECRLWEPEVPSSSLGAPTKLHSFGISLGEPDHLRARPAEALSEGGYSIVVIMRVFQTRDAGSIPATRSRKNYSVIFEVERSGIERRRPTGRAGVERDFSRNRRVTDSRYPLQKRRKYAPLAQMDRATPF